jgi:hypothetical protein
MGDAAAYGSRYWCVKTPLSENGEIYLFADDVVLLEGALVFRSLPSDGSQQVNLLLAPGQWTSVYAASVIDGAAVAVEHWKGEVLDR